MQSKTHTRPTCFFISTRELTNVDMLSASQLRIIYFFQIFKERFIGKSQYRNHQV